MENVDQPFIEKMAEKSDGFSGREIMKMVIAWHDAAFALEIPVLTPDIMEKILLRFQDMHEIKKEWGEEGSELLAKLQSPELVGRMHGHKDPTMEI